MELTADPHSPLSLAQTNMYIRVVLVLVNLVSMSRLI